MHLKNLFSNDFSISEMSAIFPVIGVANGTLYAQQAHPKDICFREEVDNDKTKLNFFRRVTITQNLLHLFPTDKNVKKRHVLTFLCPFYPLRKTVGEKLPNLRTKLPIR